MIRMLLVGLAFLIGSSLGLGSVLWAGCLWIWNDIFRPVYWARGFGILSAGWFKPVHICTAILIFALLFTLWPRRWNLGARAIQFLVIWVWVSYFFSKIPTIAFAQAVEMTKYMVPLIPISMALCYRRAQEIFLYALAGSVGVWLVHHGVITVLSGRPQIDMAIPGGQMTDRNDFLVAGNACLPLLIYLGWHYRGWFQRFVRWGSRFGSLFAVGAVFYSLSRGAALGLVAIALWWAVSTGKPAKKIGIAFVLALLALPAVPQATWERLQTIQLGGEQTEDSAYNRTVHMRTAVDMTLDHPIVGVGPDNFPQYSLLYQRELPLEERFRAEPHSLWLKCSSEYGLTMLFAFLFVVFRLLRGLYRATREAQQSADRETEAMATALSCALVGFLATGTFTSQFLSQYLWSIIALAGAFLTRPHWSTAEEAMAATSQAKRDQATATRSVGRQTSPATERPATG